MVIQGKRSQLPSCDITRRDIQQKIKSKGKKLTFPEGYFDASEDSKTGKNLIYDKENIYWTKKPRQNFLPMTFLNIS